MRLYLLRHAPALSRREWTEPDAGRPLTENGEEVARSVARRIRQLDLGLEVIVTSPYERALRTAVIVHDELHNHPVRLIEDARLEPARFTLDALDELLRPFDDDASIMLVGHEPSMTEVISQVIEGGRLALKKGGLVRIDTDPGMRTSGTLKWLIPPSVL